MSVDDDTATVGQCRQPTASHTIPTASFTIKSFTLAWGLTGAVTCVDIVWYSFSRLNITRLHSFAADVGILLILTLCCLTMHGVRLRLKNDPGRLARAMTLASERGALAIHAIIFKIVLFGSVVVFTYLSATIGWPLHDAELVRIDQALGFDWPEFVGRLNACESCAHTLVFAYHSMGAQIILLCLLLGLTGRRERLAELFVLLALTSIATILLYLAIPAAGAYPYYAPAAYISDHFSAHAGRWHYDTLLQLRNSARPLLVPDNLQGLVFFPSFHTVLAILFAYSVRDFRALFLPVAIFNTIMIISTVPEGGHNLIDVAAGILIVWGAVHLLSYIVAIEQ
jgi:membrane-associated phospholipid phosphatase